MFIENIVLSLSLFDNQSNVHLKNIYVDHSNTAH